MRAAWTLTTTITVSIALAPLRFLPGVSNEFPHRDSPFKLPGTSHLTLALGPLGPAMGRGRIHPRPSPICHPPRPRRPSSPQKKKGNPPPSDSTRRLPIKAATDLRIKYYYYYNDDHNDDDNDGYVDDVINNDGNKNNNDRQKDGVIYTLPSEHSK